MMLQKKGRYSAIKEINNQESRIIKDINHKISRKVEDIAQQTGYSLQRESLTGIRKNTKKYRKSLNWKRNSRPFYQLQQFIHHEATLVGVVVEHRARPLYLTTSLRVRLSWRTSNKSLKCLQQHSGHTLTMQA